MTSQATEARRAYKRAWAKKNPDRIREYQEKYWTKKGEQAASQGKTQKGDTRTHENI